MTGLKRPVRRETATKYRQRALVVELHPEFLVMRPKGFKTGVVVDYGAIYDLGQKLGVRRKKLKALPLIGQEAVHANVEPRA